MKEGAGGGTMGSPAPKRNVPGCGSRGRFEEVSRYRGSWREGMTLRPSHTSGALCLIRPVHPSRTTWRRVGALLTDYRVHAGISQVARSSDFLYPPLHWNSLR